MVYITMQVIALAYFFAQEVASGHMWQYENRLENEVIFITLSLQRLFENPLSSCLKLQQRYYLAIYQSHY